uniref:hypothetical protein n=1 Tax=Yoonia sp. TaxID=2212373 RepID=UPI00404833CD
MTRIIFAVLLFMFSPFSAVADDQEGDLIRFINDNKPTYFELIPSSLVFRDFPSENGGRLSVIGDFRIRGPFVEVVGGFANLSSMVGSRGYSANEVRKALDNLGFLRTFGASSVSELRVTQADGAIFSFSAELPYLETVSGIRLSGQIEVGRPIGRPLSEIQGNHYFVGSPEFDNTVELVVSRIENARVEDERRREEELRIAEEQRLAREAAEREANRVQTSPCTDQFHVRAEQEGRITNCLEITLQQGGDRHFQPGTDQFPCIRYTRPEAIGHERIDNDGDGKAEGLELYSTRGRITITTYNIAKGATFRRETCG